MLIIIIMLQHFNFIIGFATGDFCYNSLDMQWKCLSTGNNYYANNNIMYCR